MLALRVASPGSLGPLALALVSLALGAASGCALPKREPVRVESMETLNELPDFKGVRALGGYPDKMFEQRFAASVATLAERQGADGPAKDYDVLVLSAGGANGAFGAGVLAGWTASGTRPDFELVTGVSTGALIAPFAFAGSAFDERLGKLFRGSSASDVMKSKGLLRSMLWDESLMDNAPLRAQIEWGVDAELMAAVAARARAGGRCLVGTTDLDRGQFVIWDLGEIASIGTPAALELMRKVMLASASVPVVYPPVLFELESGDEMHVDGAMCQSLFLPQAVADPHEAAREAGLSWGDFDATVYVINNGCLRASPKTIQRKTLDVASRAILVMGYSSLADEVFHVFMVSRLFGAKFRFMTIRDGREVLLDDFKSEDTERLYKLGLQQLGAGPHWSHVPPGYVVNEGLLRMTTSCTSLEETD